MKRPVQQPSGYHDNAKRPVTRQTKFVECPNLTENALHIAKHSIKPDVGKSHPAEIAFVYANGLGATEVQSVSAVII
jgi:hypothetical protein